MTDTVPKAARRRRRALALVGLAVVLIAVAAYAARRIIAREALTGWLEERGVASVVQVERFGLRGFTGRIQLGDPRAPDLTVERAEIRYRPRGLGFEVVSIRLVKPVLRASLRGGKVSFGRLDPLIEELLGGPPSARSPRIVVEQGVLLAATDYGALRLTGQALVEDARLVALHAVTSPTHLKGRIAADLGTGTLRVRTTGGRAAAQLDLAVTDASGGGSAVKGGWLQASLEAPYPDVRRRRADGAVSLRATLVADGMDLSGQGLSKARLTAGFNGRSVGWADTFALTGSAAADLAAADATLGGARGQGAQAEVQAADLRWTRTGGEGLSARLSGKAGLARLAAGDLTLTRLAATFQGPLAWRPGPGADVTLAATLTGAGGWTGLGGPVSGDTRAAALKRSLRDFRIGAPGLRLLAAEGRWALGAGQPVRLTTASGGAATVHALGGQALIGSAPGALRLQMEGGGLPKVDAQVARLVLTDDGVAASGRLQASDLALGAMQGGGLDATGVLRTGANGISFAADRCALFWADRLELGENDVERITGRLCPAGGPLLSMAGGGLRVRGRAEGVGAHSALMQVQIEQGAGPVEVTGAGGALRVAAAIDGARIADSSSQSRFNPLRLSGEAVLARDVWTALLLVATPQGAPLARAGVRHETRSGVGGADIDTGMLGFEPGGLQPARLSPMAAAIGSPAEGEIRFSGRFDWSGQQAASRGKLIVPGLDFVSPAGQVSGLAGEIEFTSLAPLVAAPGQVLRVKTFTGPATFSDVTATFALDAGVIRVSGGEAVVGGGKIRIERLDVPLTPDKPVEGVVVIEGVQLHDLVEASPFGDRVDLEAKVSGRIPFEVLAGRIHVAGGELRAIEAGRISIQRTALTAVAAEGEAAQPVAPRAPGADTFTDFAYQAMEHLAFEAMDAKIDSLPAGRIGVLFHIKGRHDPPQKQGIRLPLADLLSRRFLDKPLPLPSGTEVDLTLDTTLNLDQLLSDFGEYQRLRGSGGVQP